RRGLAGGHRRLGSAVSGLAQGRPAGIGTFAKAISFKGETVMGVLDGKVVMVTGGGSGIGRECALIAAREGAKVLVNDLGGSLSGGDEGDAGPAELVAQEIREKGGTR